MPEPEIGDVTIEVSNMRFFEPHGEVSQEEFEQWVIEHPECGVTIGEDWPEVIDL